MIVETLAVASGGAIGAALRYYISVGIHSKLGVTFPYGTLFVNMLGCFILGITAAFCLRHPEMPLPVKLFVITGLLGGLTTFSTFSLETFELLLNNTVMGFINIALSICGGLALIALGMRAGA